MICLESALDKANSNLLSHKRRSNTLKDDMHSAQYTGPGNQGHVYLSQTPGTPQGHQFSLMF